MLDLHPPRIFQIDGNFGATAAIGEMILQSNNDMIEILPCIPDFMTNGKIIGLRAKGGITVNVEWKNRELIYSEVKADFDGVYKFRYKDQIFNKELRAGSPVNLL